MTSICGVTVRGGHVNTPHGRFFAVQLDDVYDSRGVFGPPEGRYPHATFVEGPYRGERNPVTGKLERGVIAVSVRDAGYEGPVVFP